MTSGRESIQAGPVFLSIVRGREEVRERLAVSERDEVFVSVPQDVGKIVI